MKFAFALLGFITALSVQAASFSTIEIENNTVSTSNTLSAGTGTCQKVDGDFLKCQFAASGFNSASLQYFLDSQYTYNNSAVLKSFQDDCQTIAENNQVIYKVLNKFAYKSPKVIKHVKYKRGKHGKKIRVIETQAVVNPILIPKNFFLGHEYKQVNFSVDEYNKHLDVANQLLSHNVEFVFIKDQKKRVVSCEDTTNLTLPYLHINNNNENQSFPICAAIKTISSTAYANAKSTVEPGHPVVENKVEVLPYGVYGDKNDQDSPGDYYPGIFQNLKNSPISNQKPDLETFNLVEKKYNKYLSVSKDIEQFCPSNLYIYNLNQVIASTKYVEDK